MSNDEENRMDLRNSEKGGDTLKHGTRPDDVFMGLPLDVGLPLGMELGLMVSVVESDSARVD